jgi:hypothetical protein
MHYEPEQTEVEAEEEQRTHSFLRSAVKRFVSEYRCTWPKPTEEEKFINSLAEEYHRRTEEYDRTVCTGPILHGGIMPASDWERCAINKNASAVKRELMDRAEQRGISPFKVTMAIQNFSR